MKLKYLILFSLFFHATIQYAQIPAIQWKKAFGGTAFDTGIGIKQTPDGGYVVVGGTTSNDGHVSGLHGSAYDVWVFKTNASGVLLWQNTLGGNSGDIGYEIYLTPDGGYLIAGYSSSNDGDVTGHHGVTVSPDLWLAKLDASGNIVWQKSLGGNGSENIGELLFDDDGGYILAGRTHSVNSGDVVGGHSIFSDDAWIVKTDSIGNVIWQKVYGGIEDEIAYDIEQTDDGGYLVIGEANSTDFDVIGNHGGYDVWVLKLNAFGDLLWQKCLGGTFDDHAFEFCRTNDDNYIIIGSSQSNDGDVSGHHGTSESSDFWILKIDSLANIIWQKSIGGTLDEEPKDIVKTLANEYLIIGGTYSNDGDISSHFGTTETPDYWTIKINDSGDVLWEISNGGSDYDYGLSLVTTSDNGFILCGHAMSEDYEIPANHGWDDIWLVKYFPECTPSLELCNSLDDNCNGLIDDAITETITISAGGPISFCQGGSVLLTATYSGASVQWKKNGTNIPGATSTTYNIITKGNYTCVTTSACGTAESTPIFVNVIKTPNASISAGGPTTFCSGGSVVLTEVAVAGCTYQWYKGATPIAGATSLTYTATTSGNYKCRVTKAATGCYKNSNAIAVSVPCKEGLSAGEVGEMFNDKNAFSIYPNPNNGAFTIEAIVTTQNFASLESTIEIYNNLGQLIFSKKVIANDGIINEAIELKNITPGIYLVKLWNNNIYNVKNIIIE